MNAIEFKALMDTIGIPNTYYSWPVKNVPEPPYFVWYFEGSENFGADDVVYAEILSPIIELYTRRKSFEDEAAIETVLKANGFFWDKTETFVESEGLHMVTFDIGDFVNGEQN